MPFCCKQLREHTGSEDYHAFENYHLGHFSVPSEVKAEMRERYGPQARVLLLQHGAGYSAMKFCPFCGTLITQAMLKEDAGPYG